MGKTNMTLSIDESVVMRAKLAKINISQNVEDFLRAFLVVDPKDDEERVILKEKEMIDDEISKLNLKSAELQCRLNSIEKLKKERKQQNLNEIVSANKALQASGILRDLE